MTQEVLDLLCDLTTARRADSDEQMIPEEIFDALPPADQAALEPYLLAARVPYMAEDAIRPLTEEANEEFIQYFTTD